MSLHDAGCGPPETDRSTSSRRHVRLMKSPRSRQARAAGPWLLLRKQDRRSRERRSRRRSLDRRAESSAARPTRERPLYWKASGANKAPLSLAHSRRRGATWLVIAQVDMRRLARIELGPGWLKLPLSRECDHIGGSLELSAAGRPSPIRGRDSPWCLTIVSKAGACQTSRVGRRSGSAVSSSTTRKTLCPS
jgi:hypothetical protein